MSKRLAIEKAGRGSCRRTLVGAAELLLTVDGPRLALAVVATARIVVGLGTLQRFIGPGSSSSRRRMIYRSCDVVVPSGAVGRRVSAGFVIGLADDFFSSPAAGLSAGLFRIGLREPGWLAWLAVSVSGQSDRWLVAAGPLAAAPRLGRPRLSPAVSFRRRVEALNCALNAWSSLISSSAIAN